MDEIVLYPGNWLYNAGVIGFLKVVEKFKGKSTINSWMDNKDGVIKIDKKDFNNLFKSISLGQEKIPLIQKYYVEYYFEYLNNSDKFSNWLLNTKDGVTNKEKYKDFEFRMGEFGYRFVYVGNKLFASNTPYQNFLMIGEDWQSLKFSKFLEEIPNFDGNKTCGLCGLKFAKEPKQKDKMEERLFKFQHVHMPNLGPSIGNFPNSFWNENSMLICPFCDYLFLHYGFSFIPLSDKSKIFINSPSFQVMWHLNQLIKEIYEKGDYHNTQELLGMSLVELTLRLKAQLGTWVGMNIEIITNEQNFIDFYSLPYEVTCMLLDRKIASFISDIGELSILQIILNKNFNKLMELGERLMPLTFKNFAELNKHERQFIYENLRLQKNRNNLSWFVSQIFNLYTLIKDKVGGDTT